jgi:hypothetical protein
MMPYQGGMVLSGRSNRRGFVAALGKRNQACGGAAFVLLLTLMVSVVQAEEAKDAAARSWRIDTEHLFGFVIGTDVGNVGDKEVEAEVTSGFGKRPGSYAAFAPSLEYEFVPIDNLRLAPSLISAVHSISGVDGIDDRQQAAFDGLSFDVRYRILDRSLSGVGLTINAEPHWGLVDETSGQWVDRYGADFAIAVDRELIPDRVIAAINVLYQPETSRLHRTGAWTRDATAGIATGLMIQVFPGILIGGEARQLWKYEGIGLDHMAGRALFVGPTMYARLTARSWMIAAWSAQTAGRAVEFPGALDVTNFTRYQAKIQFGFEF